MSKRGQLNRLREQYLLVFLFVLGRKLFSKRVGAAAAILLTLSQRSLLHTRFAQEANLSTLLTLVGVTEEGELLSEKIDVIDRET